MCKCCRHMGMCLSHCRLLPCQWVALSFNELPQLPSTSNGLQGAKAAHKEAALLELASTAFREGRTIVFFATKQAAHRARLQFGLAELSAR